MVIAAPAVVFEGPLSASNLDAVTTLRRVLVDYGFLGTAVADALGGALPFNKSHLRDDLPLYLRRLAAPSAVNTLIKLFVLDRWVDSSSAAEALAPLRLDDLRAMGLVEDGPHGIRARVRLSAHDGLLVAHDAYDEERRTLRPDHVLDVNPTTLSLSYLTVRRPVDRALEIGTGCGALALKAARHARQVVATDTNPRALNLAAFNAALNGVTNVEWRLGSLFDTVAGETFDLIFSNPPYVISPDSQFIFRDGGRRGDALCAEIVAGAPAHLNEGGFATVLVNWGIRDGEQWADPLRRWVADNGCDNWLMLSAAQDPMSYAAIWTRSREREVYDAALDRWTTYFNELSFRAIGLGAIVMRRGTGHARWVRADHLSDSVTAEAGSHLERLFAAEDLLASLTDDAALLAQAFVAAPDHELQQAQAVRGNRYAVTSAQVRLLNGLPFHGAVDPYTVQLLERCDGRRSLASIARELAAAAGADHDRFSTAFAGIARRLIAQGFLVPPRGIPASSSSPDRLEGSVP